MNRSIRLLAAAFVGLILAPSAWAANPKKDFAKEKEELQNLIKTAQDKLNDMIPKDWQPYFSIEQDLHNLGKLFAQTTAKPELGSFITKKRIDTIDDLIQNLGKDTQASWFNFFGTGKSTAWEQVKNLPIDELLKNQAIKAISELIGNKNNVEFLVTDAWDIIKKQIAIDEKEAAHIPQDPAEAISAMGTFLKKFDVYTELEKNKVNLSKEIKKAHEETVGKQTDIDKMTKDLDEKIKEIDKQLSEVSGEDKKKLEEEKLKKQKEEDEKKKIENDKIEFKKMVEELAKEFGRAEEEWKKKVEKITNNDTLKNSLKKNITDTTKVFMEGEWRTYSPENASEAKRNEIKTNTQTIIARFGLNVDAHKYIAELLESLTSAGMDESDVKDILAGPFETILNNIEKTIDLEKLKDLTKIDGYAALGEAKDKALTEYNENKKKLEEEKLKKQKEEKEKEEKLKKQKEEKEKEEKEKEEKLKKQKEEDEKNKKKLEEKAEKTLTDFVGALNMIKP